MRLAVQRLSEHARLPTRGSELAAGYDLYSAHDYEIPARGLAVCKTDIAIALPPHCYGRVAPRSGLAVRSHIDTGAGVIDADYRGNVGVVLFNHGDAPFKVSRNDRIAQLIIQVIETPDVVEVASLDDTQRADGGFGSTGV